MNLLIILLFMVGIYADEKAEWFPTIIGSYLFEIFGGLIVAANWLIIKLKPHIKEDLIEEHNKVVDILKSM